MASTLSLSEDDFSCSVCHDIFNDPVVLACSHSFCTACLQNWWTHKGVKECPVCQKINRGKPPCNLSLKNVCEAFMRERQPRASKRPRTSSRSADLCSLHAERLDLFCLRCQQPACVVCRDSRKHKDHTLTAIAEAALHHKEDVQKSLEALRKKLEVFNQVKTTCDKAKEHIMVQTQNTETEIREQFQKLRQFLHEDEEVRIAALREERRQKRRRMKKKIKGLNKDMATLSQTIGAIEEDLGAEHMAFLQNYKATMERFQLTIADPQLVPGALMDVAQHLGNLTFRVWEQMKDIVSYSPVILDPNTAHQKCTVSGDLTSVTCVKQQLPDNPERSINRWVLGSEGFNTGTHSWEVEVGHKAFWETGVAKCQSISKKAGGKWAMWAISTSNDECFMHHTGAHHVDLRGKLPKPKRVRVQLDCDRGKISFSDADTNKHIHTYTHKFTDPLFPYIEAIPSMKMLPRKVNVTVG